MKKKYFGQGCINFVGQWEDERDAREAGIDYTQWIPVLSYCNHPDNREDVEGNCNRQQCPLFVENKKLEAIEEK